MICIALTSFGIVFGCDLCVLCMLFDVHQHLGWNNMSNMEIMLCRWLHFVLVLGRSYRIFWLNYHYHF